MKTSEEKPTTTTEQESGKCTNPNCKCEDCKCGSNCTCTDCK